MNCEVSTLSMVTTWMETTHRPTYSMAREMGATAWQKVSLLTPLFVLLPDLATVLVTCHRGWLQ